MIPISRHYEPLIDIPEGSFVELENGHRVHYVRTENANDSTERFLPEARIVGEGGVTQSADPFTPARYICSIIDYEARANIS